MKNSPLLALEVEGATWQGMQVALADGQQGNGALVL